MRYNVRRLIVFATARSLVPTAFCEAPGADSDNAELLLVQVLFRHGARTPLTDRYWEGVQWNKGSDCGEAFKAVQLRLRGTDDGPEPTSSADVKQASTIWPGGCRKGELTAKGWQQSRELGEWLRKRYTQQIPFLPIEHRDGDIYARTTNFARTKATLQGVLTGLYSNAGPVPALTSSHADEILIGTPSCKQLKDLQSLQMALLQKEEKEQANASTLDKEVRSALNLPDGEAIAWVDLFDALTACKAHDKGWPQGMTEDMYSKIELEALKRISAVVSMQASSDYGADILRLSMGQLLHEMMERMDAAASGSKPEAEKLLLLSGHDTTIIPIMDIFLGDSFASWPPYTANVVIELWQRKGVPPGQDACFVRAFYNQEELQLPGSTPGTPLSLTEFKQQFWNKHALSKDEYQQQCEVRREAPRQGPAVGGDSIQGI